MTQFDKLALTRRDALRRGLAAVAASGAFFGATRGAFAEDTLAEIKKRGELTTATEMQFPPFDISDNGIYKGLDRDLIDAVGKEMGVKVSYLDLPWTSVLPGLEAKKFDLCIAPVTITKERMKRYAFSVPIADATAALMKRANDSSIMKPEDIAGKTVGGQKGTSQVEQLKAFAAKLPKPVEVKEYVDNNQSYADLAAGRIDASVNSFPNLAYVGPAALRYVRCGDAAVRPADLFFLGRPARRQVADGRDQRGDRQGRGRRDDGEDPEDLVRADDGPAQDRPRADDLTADDVEERESRRPPSLTAAALMKPEVILHSFGYLTHAAATTVAVSFAGIVFGFLIGAAVCAARVSRRDWLKRLGAAYVSVFRGVPLLVQLLFIYYFLAEYGLDVPAIVAAVGGLSLSSAAYQAEILRGALNAVPRGQGEAATALGFAGLDIWRRILMPQALRISTPPLINEFILLLKASSLVSVVGIAELTRVSMNIASQTYRPFEAYVGGGMFYLAINLCLAALGALAERRLAAGSGR